MSSAVKKIIETKSFEEIVKHLSANTLILFDVDNTLIEACQHFGSVQWGEDYQQKLIQEGQSPDQANRLLHEFWIQKILPVIPMRLVDEKIPAMMEFIRQKGHFILGLTARHPDEACYTHPQLSQFGISFDHLYPNQQIELQHPAVYEQGILFCGVQNKKSETLKNFITKNNLAPQRVIFVDDKVSQIEDVKRGLDPFDMDYIGIRLSATDVRVQSYDPRIAEIQAKFLPHFLSDEEAHQLLLQHEGKRLW
ncbi:MAG: DUF2608 domain-containing protein [Verrucomicrobia bacterium]|nr:DUF2608 domain-containing protein [Verrucomicrobiota bacterium]MBS0645126.1 DUF2608 domain-containing protein [Verrucomicrobiota bacterium]